MDRRSLSPQELDLSLSEVTILEDQTKLSEWGATRLTVAVRCRPMTDREGEVCRKKWPERSPVVIRVQDAMVFLLDPETPLSPSVASRHQFHRMHHHHRKEKVYTFDQVYDEFSMNEEVYEGTAKPLVTGVMAGFNATCFAYGMTGAGKTYTMMGENDIQGIYTIAVKDLFDRIRADFECEYDVRVSFLEIYNEKIKDLIDVRDETKVLEIQEDPERGMIVQDLSEYVVKTLEEVGDLLVQGNKRRTMASTSANVVSSRSHAVFQMIVEQRPRTRDIVEEVSIGKLNLIDLAGSERAARSENRGIRMIEGANINRSLLALGNCINILGDSTRKAGTYVPYRDSKLTRLLKDSLGGNTQTVMIANISPSRYYYEETQNTLKYASRAKNIQHRIQRNTLSVEQHVSAYKRIITSLREEVSELKRRLEIVALEAHPHPSVSMEEIEAELKQARRVRQEVEESSSSRSQTGPPDQSSLIQSLRHEKLDLHARCLEYQKRAVLAEREARNKELEIVHLTDRIRHQGALMQETLRLTPDSEAKRSIEHDISSARDVLPPPMSHPARLLPRPEYFSDRGGTQSATELRKRSSHIVDTTSTTPSVTASPATATGLTTPVRTLDLSSITAVETPATPATEDRPRGPVRSPKVSPRESPSSMRPASASSSSSRRSSGSSTGSPGLESSGSKGHSIHAIPVLDLTRLRSKDDFSSDGKRSEEHPTSTSSRSEDGDRPTGGRTSARGRLESGPIKRSPRRATTTSDEPRLRSTRTSSEERRRPSPRGSREAGEGGPSSVSLSHPSVARTRVDLPLPPGSGTPPLAPKPSHPSVPPPRSAAPLPSSSTSSSASSTSVSAGKRSPRTRVGSDVSSSSRRSASRSPSPSTSSSTSKVGGTQSTPSYMEDTKSSLRKQILARAAAELRDSSMDRATAASILKSPRASSATGHRTTEYVPAGRPSSSTGVAGHVSTSSRPSASLSPYPSRRQRPASTLGKAGISSPSTPSTPSTTPSTTPSSTSTSTRAGSFLSRASGVSVRTGGLRSQDRTSGVPGSRPKSVTDPSSATSALGGRRSRDPSPSTASSSSSADKRGGTPSRGDLSAKPLARRTISDILSSHRSSSTTVAERESLRVVHQRRAAAFEELQRQVDAILSRPATLSRSKAAQSDSIRETIESSSSTPGDRSGREPDVRTNPKSLTQLQELNRGFLSKRR
eukprot:TRINITY_DN15586_c0_g2_i1.p1 TRINITY_DN15586_c0_g2~~TRINITY_DN15586_c0_g2_i1.p1  ORF type:complete len:1199 (+),score=329.70 TRINITY_DN15586_c0_g2_i1:443-4039(+)